jgi:adenylate cyclase
MENKEIERKFLVVDDSFRSLATTHYDIIQGYISREQGRSIRIRLRTAADGSQKDYLTIKTRLESFTRFKCEKPISVEDFRALLPLCGNRIIDKTRYILPAEPASLKWEIDEFRSPNAGLIMAEIELPAEDTPFSRPTFIGEEVTHDPRYYNANML